MLTIKRPCDGISYWESGEYKTGFCHESHDCFQMVTFGTLELKVVLCGHAWGDGWGRRETIHEFVEEHYGPLILSSKDNRRFNKHMTAYETGSGGQHVHSWGICGNPLCGFAARYPYEWSNNPDDQIRNQWSRSSWEESNRFWHDCVYCCFECFALTTNLSRCASCGEYTTRTFNKQWSDATYSMFFNYALTLNRVPDSRVFKLCFSPVCSSLCARRHKETIKQSNRQLNMYDKEFECLRDVKQLVIKAKKALRSNDRGALSLLRKEFEQVATSPE